MKNSERESGVRDIRHGVALGQRVVGVVGVMSLPRSGAGPQAVSPSLSPLSGNRKLSHRGMGRRSHSGHPSRWTISVMFLLIGILNSGSDSLAQPPGADGRKQMTATRIPEGSVELDGRLDEAVWVDAPFVSDFLQKEPNEGALPDERTEVRILYDDHYLYIGARMYCRAPADLRLDLNRRDNPGNSEQMIVSLDTYYDRRTCYEFGVSAAGVRTDRYHPEDNEYRRDMSYNPVWDARTHIDDEGWTAELRVPFSQLRFNRKSRQVWGINLNRWIPARREDNFWICVPRNETGWSSYFGDLVGIEGIAPSRRIELLPYVAGDGQFRTAPDPADPFRDGTNFNGRIGTDLKMGLGPNLTLDATVNPDFGQVEADPAEVNLTDFETIFSERRPFFIEGSQLFTDGVPSYFYSRRIGAAPHGSADGDFVDRPNNTTILGAGKVTGRLASGTSIGFLGAITSRETARTLDTTLGIRDQMVIEPVTGYGVARIQQEFGADRSTVGLLLTAVERDLNERSQLTGVLRKRAYTGGADWRLRFQGGMYEIAGNAGFSYVNGDTSIIRKTQESSARYYQRPDADYLPFDPTRTSLSGYTGTLRINKNAGRHWLWGAGAAFESPGFELNDAGRLRSADDIDAWINIRYRENEPGPLFRTYRIALSTDRGWNFGGDRQYAALGFSASATLTNYWNIFLDLNFQPRSLSDSKTRGGPLMETPRGFWAGAGLDNSFSANTRYSANAFYNEDEDGGWGYEVSAMVSTRLGRRLYASLEPRYLRDVDVRQYIETIPGGPVATYGFRYIFATVDQSQLSARLRLNYFFTPDLSLEVYAEPFAASGRYSRFGELTAARRRDLRVYGEAPGTAITGSDGVYHVTDGGEFTFTQGDFGVRSFRSNVVLRWEFRPGSTLFLVWQQNRSANENPGVHVGPRALGRTLKASGENFVAIKIAYWIPVS